MIDPAPREARGPSSFARTRWIVAGVVLYTLGLLAVAVLAHPTPLYFVETDLVGEYIPAARALASGSIAIGHQGFKGPGYPVLLALAAPPLGGDYFLAARVVSVLSAGVAAGFAFLVVSTFAGFGVGCVALAGMLVNPEFVRYAIEAGTDAPALALMMVATWGILRPGRSFATLLVAGLAAGWAIVTRYNAAFLVPAAIVLLLLPPRRPLGLALYVLAAALPWAAWTAYSIQVTGHPIPDRNYLNVAFELYGRDLPWDQFEIDIGSRFHSLLDVLAYDPGRAALRIAWNLAAHATRDLVELTPIWIGALIPLGMIRVARRPAWRPAWLHAGACALALAPVFYSPRFSLYLLPFGLAAAGVLVAEAPEFLSGPIAALARHRVSLRRCGAVAMTVAMIACAASAVQGTRARLADAPEETRRAGAWLARQGLAGERIMARKPQVAYFAGMEFCAMGPSASIHHLLEEARAAGARYVFYSPIERRLRPELALLSDSGVALPGLEPVLYDTVGEGRFYAVYRVGGEPVDSLALANAVEGALRRYADRRADDPAAQVFASVQLLALGRPREAVERLTALERAGARDATVATLLSTAYFTLGDNRESERECRLAMTYAPPTAWHHARLAAIAEKEGRWADARDAYRLAVEAEPANLDYLARLGRAYMAVGKPALAAETFERCLRLAPQDATLRRFAMGAYQIAGDPRRARRVFDDGLRSGLSATAMLGNATETREPATP